MRITDFKYCSKCTQHKHQDEFAANVRAKSGKQPWCRACMSEHCAAKRSKTQPIPRGCIEYLGRQMTIRQFAQLVGISHYTVQDRWQRGERTIEELSRRPPPRMARQKAVLPKEELCLNSLLAGWKLVPGASEMQIGRSANMERATVGDMSCGT